MNNYFKRNSTFRKILMSENLDQEMVGFCKNGGKKQYFFAKDFLNPLFLLGMIEFSSFVTIKKTYRFYLKMKDDSNYEIFGEEEDRLICPFIWNSFKNNIKGRIIEFIINILLILFYIV